MIRMGVGRVAAAAIVVAASTVVSGCSLIAPAAPRPTPTQTATPDAVPIAQQLPDLRVAGQTIATGQLRAVEHDPLPDEPSTPPLTGAVRVVVDSSLRVEVHVRPDTPLPPTTSGSFQLTGYELVATNARHDRRSDPPQRIAFGLTSSLARVSEDGEVVLPIPPGFTTQGDPSYLHSIEETAAGTVVAAAVLAWTLPSPYPSLRAVDHGAVSFARGTTIVEDGVLTGYVPNPYDTLFAVSRRFGLTEVELAWLNPALLAASPDPEMKYGIPIALDPASR
ncbi:hypothetical protein BJ963_000652 [Leifsonia soli]|uniref:LysM domain-containing protein n=1 Tax=Leifsonia soli TaxID=582665 RepID=A0A852SWQ0_9MICO|nr:hypothetical protein [Leifsonia soli]NYD73133.1 hypothetical protein [Leifsonia soli]